MSGWVLLNLAAAAGNAFCCKFVNNEVSCWFGEVASLVVQGFLAEGLERTSAGLGSVIIDSQPLTVAVLAAVLFGEALSGAL
jgi:drug/metabolite transporter (DMT)-like permease